MSLELIGSAGECPLNLDDCTICPQISIGCPEGMKKLAALEGSRKYLHITDVEKKKMRDGLAEPELSNIVNRTYKDAEKFFNDIRLLYPYGEVEKIASGTLKAEDFMRENVIMKKFYEKLKLGDYDINKVLIVAKESTQNYSLKGTTFGSDDFSMYSPVKIVEREIDDEHLAVRMITSSLARRTGFQAEYGMIFTRPAIQERIQVLRDELEGDQTSSETQAIEEAIAREIQAAVKTAADIASASLSATITSAVGVVPETTIENTISQMPKKERDYRGALSLLTALGSYISLLMLNTRFGVKPEIICGPVPLYSVQMTERAKSDRKLKNRAIGAVFLAHQKETEIFLE